jgi:hypothetical protein
VRYHLCAKNLQQAALVGSSPAGHVSSLKNIENTAIYSSDERE